MDSHPSGIERFIIFLSVKKIYFNVFTHKWIRIIFFIFSIFTPKNIMNRSIPLRCESIKIQFYYYFLKKPNGSFYST